MNYLPQEEEKRRYELYNQKLNDAQIAERLYISPVTVQSWRRNRGLPPNQQRGRPKKRREEKENKMRQDKSYEYYCEYCNKVYALTKVRSLCSLCGQGLYIREVEEGENDT